MYIYIYIYTPFLIHIYLYMFICTFKICPFLNLRRAYGTKDQRE